LKIRQKDNFNAIHELYNRFKYKKI
jgi:hypothetical protein